MFYRRQIEPYIQYIYVYIYIVYIDTRAFFMILLRLFLLLVIIDLHFITECIEKKFF